MLQVALYFRHFLPGAVDQIFDTLFERKVEISRLKKNIAHKTPPMITRAKGRELSDPIPVEMAAGNKPIASIKAVIITGLTLECTPALIAPNNV